MTPETSPLEPLVRKLAYRVTFDADDVTSIRDLPHQLKRIERAGYIVRERDRATHSCLMLSGFSMRHKVGGDGARQIVAIHMKGEMVDLQNSMLKIADHSVQALTECQVAFIPRQAVKQVALERPRVGMAMWLDTLVDGSIFREWIMNVGRRDAHTRIAHLLCEFSLRLKVAGLGEQTNYELPMTQEQLADATGLTAVHVNRTLKALVQEGMIERNNGRGIIIGDWHKLAEAGDFDSTYLHMPEGEPALG
jgi:CRP-like cAMP-binding protein